MIGDVFLDPNKSIDDYDELTYDQTVTLLEDCFGRDNIYVSEWGEGYILVVADYIYSVHGKTSMFREMDRLNLRWGYHPVEPDEEDLTDMLCIYISEEVSQ